MVGRLARQIRRVMAKSDGCNLSVGSAANMVAAQYPEAWKHPRVMSDGSRNGSGVQAA